MPFRPTFPRIIEKVRLMGVAGFIIVFVLVSVGFMAMVRRSLKRAMGQSDQGNSSAQHDEPM